MLSFSTSGPIECNLYVCFCLIVFIKNILFYSLFVVIIMCIVILNNEKRINC